MSDFDLERLGDVWRQQPDPAELEELRRSADLVRQHARWAQLVDALSAVLVAGVVLFLVLANPRADTALVGGAAILALMGSQYRSRRLRKEELRALTGTTEEMLDQSIERVRAILKRTRFQLLSVPPGLLIGIAVAAMVDRTSSGALLARVISEFWTSLALMAVAVGAVAAMWAYSARQIRRWRDELERLTMLRESYRQEGESSAAE